MSVARSRYFLGSSVTGRARLSMSIAGAAAALAIGDLAACASSTASTSGDGTGDASGGNGDEDGSASDAGAGRLDGSSRNDAADGATAPANVDGPGAEGATCSFNRDCHLALRCECDETNGCACKTGARGTGKNGIDPCASGNDCTSSVCVEGPPDSGSFCSDECKTSSDCAGVLPLCSDVAFVGRICIRTAPQ